MQKKKKSLPDFVLEKSCSSIAEMPPDGPCCSEIRVSLCYIKWPGTGLLQSDHNPSTMCKILKKHFLFKTEIKTF